MFPTDKLCVKLYNTLWCVFFPPEDRKKETAKEPDKSEEKSGGDDKVEKRDAFDSENDEDDNDDVKSTTSLDPEMIEVVPFKDLDALEQVKENPRRFRCKLCRHRFTRSYDVKMHLKNNCEKRELQLKQFKCTQCDESFEKKASYTKHLTSHRERFACLCSKDFKYVKALEKHKENCVVFIKSLKQSGTEEQKTPVKKDPERVEVDSKKRRSRSREVGSRSAKEEEDSEKKRKNESGSRERVSRSRSKSRRPHHTSHRHHHKKHGKRSPSRSSSRSSDRRSSWRYPKRDRSRSRDREGYHHRHSSESYSSRRWNVCFILNYLMHHCFFYFISCI